MNVVIAISNDTAPDMTVLESKQQSTVSQEANLDQNNRDHFDTATHYTQLIPKKIMEVTGINEKFSSALFAVSIVFVLSLCINFIENP